MRSRPRAPITQVDPGAGARSRGPRRRLRRWPLGRGRSGDAHRSPRREATRQRILDAAREVFAERGVIGGSVEDICERAGFTRGAFYSNFADKDDILAALIEREHARLLRHLDESLALVLDRELAEAPSSWRPPCHRSSSGSCGPCRWTATSRWCRPSLQIHAVRRPELARPFIEANVRFRARIAAFIEEAMARNGLELTVDSADLVDAARRRRGAERATRPARGRRRRPRRDGQGGAAGECSWPSTAGGTLTPATGPRGLPTWDLQRPGVSADPGV